MSTREVLLLRDLILYYNAWALSRTFSLSVRSSGVFSLTQDLDLSKDPGPEDPALVIPRGDLVSWNLNGLWSDGVLE